MLFSVNDMNYKFVKNDESLLLNFFVRMRIVDRHLSSICR